MTIPTIGVAHDQNFHWVFLKKQVLHTFVAGYMDIYFSERNEKLVRIMERKIFTNNMHSQTKSQTTIESVRPTFKVQNPHYKIGMS